ncbi:MAG: DMT family transporter [Rhodothermales bacterium]
MTAPRDHAWKAEAALILVIFIWGFNFPIVKFVLQVMHPHVLNAFRFVASVTVLGGLYVHGRRSLGLPLWQPLRDHGRYIASLGLLGFLVYQFCFIVGINLTTAGNAALIMASSPLWTAMTGYWMRTESLSRGSWIALFVVLLGAVIIVLGGTDSVHFGSDTFVGNLIMLAAALTWGVYTALNKPALRYVSPTGLTFLGLLFALPFLFALGIPYYNHVVWDQITWVHWTAVIYSGALSTGLAIALWNNAVNRVGASDTAVFGNLVPVVAVFSSYFMLGETITVSQVIGGLFVIGGVLAMRRARHPIPAPPQG